ncbi:MAG: hypothetical protein J1F36_05455 [Clostridiales bacterium]|nr:hypothetical protein [Clostridiales bacterium]
MKEKARLIAIVGMIFYLAGLALTAVGLIIALITEYSVGYICLAIGLALNIVGVVINLLLPIFKK